MNSTNQTNQGKINQTHVSKEASFEENKNLSNRQVTTIKEAIENNLIPDFTWW